MATTLRKTVFFLVVVFMLFVTMRGALATNYTDVINGAVLNYHFNSGWDDTLSSVNLTTTGNSQIVSNNKVGNGSFSIVGAQNTAAARSAVSSTIASGRTWAGWVNVSSVLSSGAFQVIFSVYDTSNRYFGVFYQTDQFAYVENDYGVTGVRWGYAATTSARDVWHYVVMRQNDGEVPQIWVDGVNQSVSWSGPGTTPNVTGYSGLVGVGAFSDDTENLNGNIDEMTYWNRTLSDDEVGFLNNHSSWEYPFNVSPPVPLVVSLVSPPNASLLGVENETFSFNVTGTTPFVCSVYVDGNVSGSSIVVNVSVGSFNLSTQIASFLADGLNHTWFVNCTDNASLAGVSEEWMFQVGTPAPAVVVNMTVFGWQNASLLNNTPNVFSVNMTDGAYSAWVQIVYPDATVENRTLLNYTPTIFYYVEPNNQTGTYNATAVFVNSTTGYLSVNLTGWSFKSFAPVPDVIVNLSDIGWRNASLPAGVQNVFSVNTTDGAYAVWMQLQYPNATVANKTLTNVTPTIFYYDESNVQVGTYTVSAVFANSTTGNMSEDVSGWSFVSVLPPSLPITTHIVAPPNGTVINTSVNATMLTFNVTGNEPFMCSLYLNASLNQSLQNNWSAFYAQVSNRLELKKWCPDYAAWMPYNYGCGEKKPVSFPFTWRFDDAHLPYGSNPYFALGNDSAQASMHWNGVFQQNLSFHDDGGYVFSMAVPRCYNSACDFSGKIVFVNESYAQIYVNGSQVYAGAFLFSKKTLDIYAWNDQGGDTLSFNSQVLMSEFFNGTYTVLPAGFIRRGSYAWQVGCNNSVETNISGPGQFYMTYLCSANWSCTSYGSCPATRSSCVAAVDINDCQDTYAGDYSEFPKNNSCVLGFSSYSCPLTYPVEDAQAGQTLTLSLNATYPLNNTVLVASSEGDAVSCVRSSLSLFVCNVTRKYWEAPGFYDFSANVTDGLVNASITQAGACEYGELFASQRVGDYISCPNAVPGVTNSACTGSVVMRNTGNVLVNVSIRAYDIPGVTYPGDVLSASAVKAGTSLGAASSLTNGTTLVVTNIVPAQSANASLSFWVTMSGSQRSQAYLTVAPWQTVVTG